MPPGGTAGEPSLASASFIETNGLRVLPLLLVPVMLTGICFLAVLITGLRQPARKLPLAMSLWPTAVLLLGFCAVGILSIGILYLPAAVALVIAALIGSSSQSGG